MSTSTAARQVNEGALSPQDQPPSPTKTSMSVHDDQSSTADPAKSVPSLAFPSINISPLPPPLSGNKKGPIRLPRKDNPGKDLRNTKDSRDEKDVKDTSTITKNASSIAPSPAAIDPLSHQIIARTNTERSLASRLRNPTRPDSPANEGLPRASSDLSAKVLTPQLESIKDKRKGGSFLSRLSMIGGKKREDDDLDDESELSEQRTEGANAIAFSSTVAAGGYIPQHKEPPRYIRMRAHSKKVKEFNRTFLAQELEGTKRAAKDSSETSQDSPGAAPRLDKKTAGRGGPIWAVEFSKDGRYLATGGRDHVVRIWGVIASQEDRKSCDEEAQKGTGQEERLSAPVFRPKPIHEFTGHAGDILDLSWSKNNFLLSTSMDKTVRLWHLSRQECLCTFKHKDFVTSIAFHPRDDRFFLAGSLDSTLRLWSIPDKAVAYSSQLTDLVTAVAFTPDGNTAIAGCLNGYCIFYETEGLKYRTQIHVRSSRGKNAKGSKITGIQTRTFVSDLEDGIVKVLITSNDSRIRVYNIGDKILETKLKGHENTCNQIRASFSDDGSYVICGSEDRRAFIWSVKGTESENKEKHPCEYFEAHSDIVTEAVFAPTKTRQLLQSSHDPIFTLCNPPPVTLRSREESTATETTVCDVLSENSARGKISDESPAFVARSSHYDGNILVTADDTGLIKVFRQDCAFAKRRHETWDTGSTFSKKLGRDGLLGRTASIITRNSAGSREPHSRRGSITQAPQGAFHINPERIHTWRQGIEGNLSRPVSISASTPARSERSLSPSKASRTPIAAPSTSNNHASEARKLPYMNQSSPALPPTSPTSSTFSTPADNERLRGGARGQRTERDQQSTLPPTPSFSFLSYDDNTSEDPRPDPVGASYSFWNLNKWRNISQLRGIGAPTSKPPANTGPTRTPRRSSETSRAPDTSPLKPNRRKSMGPAMTETTGAPEKKSDHRPEKTGRRKSVPASAAANPPDEQPQ